MCKFAFARMHYIPERHLLDHVVVQKNQSTGCHANLANTISIEPGEFIIRNNIFYKMDENVGWEMFFIYIFEKKRRGLHVSAAL